ncbi:MAG TPA: hypothetical protein DDZ91_04860 [Firmicutes bacterium]|jgi:phosphate:Na+ symporter|nr:hypothetical protein [Bacillota bacterium]
MNAVQALIGLAGGLGMFLYGMKMCSDGLQKIAAGKLKQLVKVLTKSPLRGIFVGTLITVGLQSSSATCAIVVSLISAKVMTLAQALGVLLGSAIGSSLTTQLIAFKITDFALVLIFSGACLFLFTKRSRRRSLGQILLGFGLIFYGMFVMSSAMAPIKDYPLVAAMIISLENYPFLAFLVALIVTAILQSSAGFLALLMTLAGQGLVGSYAMIPFVLGAHLGGTITGVLSSLGTPGRESKRAAWANFGFKLINGLLFLPLYRPLTTFVLWSSPDLSRQIANAHTIFSLAMALGFLPFTSSVAKLMQQLIPEKAGGLGEAKYLKENLLEVPELAVDQAHRQTVEMGIIVSDMMKRLFSSLRDADEEILDYIIETEQAVDALYLQISKYVTTLDSTGFSEDLLLRSVQILYTVNDLEHIGDILMNVVQIARKANQERLSFSQEGFEEIETLYVLVSASLTKALKAFEHSDSQLAHEVIKGHPKILRYEKELRYNHFERMQLGNEKTIATSSLHLDLVEALLRQENHAVNIAQVVVGIV